MASQVNRYGARTFTTVLTRTPLTGPFPKSDKPNPYLKPYFPTIQFNIILYKDNNVAVVCGFWVVDKKTESV